MALGLRVWFGVVILLHLCCGSAADAGSCSVHQTASFQKHQTAFFALRPDNDGAATTALQKRLRGGEGLMDKADRIVTDYLFRLS
jgi:hypothetical protein